jgi:hypothetical protein
MKKLLFYLLINIAIFFICLFFVEMVLRGFSIYFPNSTKTIYLANNTSLQIRKPNSSRVNKIENYNIVRYNSLGFHDFDHANLNNKKFKLCFIGDSFVEGAQINREFLFTSYLSRRFSNHEFFNFGTSGTGTAYQYVLYNSYLNKITSFDHVFLCLWLGNDIDDCNPNSKTHPNYAWIVNDSGNIEQINKIKYSNIQNFFRVLRNYSALANMFYDQMYRYKRIKRLSKKIPDSSPVKTSVENKLMIEKIDSLNVQNIKKLISSWAFEVGNDKFSVVIFDYDEHKKSESTNFLIELLEASALKVIPVNMKDNEKTHFNGKGHYNEIGHKEVSIIIANYIENNLFKD